MLNEKWLAQCEKELKCQLNGDQNQCTEFNSRAIRLKETAISDINGTLQSGERYTWPSVLRAKLWSAAVRNQGAFD